MADPNTNLYVYPLISGNSGYRPTVPFREAARLGEERMNMPTVVALVISIIMFGLFLWFFLSPLFLKRSRSVPPRPIDVEDAYFVDENIKTPPLHVQGPLNDSTDTYAADDTKRSSSPRTVASPPPTYTSRPNSPGMKGMAPFFNSLAPSGGSSGSPRSFQRQRPFRNLLGVQNMLTRSVSAPLAISKPIPHPELPLPGPDVLAESNARKAAPSNSEETPSLRPCAAPHSVSDSTLQPPAIYIASPAQAVVHNVRDSLSRSFSERFSPIGRFSAVFGQRATNERNVSITSSKIGLAF